MFNPAQVLIKLPQLFHSAPKLPAEPQPVTFNDLTELLCDFELECSGVGHQIALHRGNDGRLLLKYSYIPWGERHGVVSPMRTRSVLVTSDDMLPLRVRHDRLMQEMGKV